MSRKILFAALPLLAVVPLMWIVPDWIGSGQLLHASAVSRKVVPTGAAAAGSALSEAALNPPIPLTVCGLAFIAFDRGGRSGTYGRIALLVLAWFLLLVILMFVFSPVHWLEWLPGAMFLLFPIVLGVLTEGRALDTAALGAAIRQAQRKDPRTQRRPRFKPSKVGGRH